MAKAYKYLDDRQNVVIRVSDNLRFYPQDNPEFMKWEAEGNTPDPADPPSIDAVLAGFTAAIQARLDDFAKTRNYDGILSACTYATSLVPKFKAEGQYCVEARDGTWSAAYTIIAAVQSGQRPMPTLDEVLAELPALAWPA